MRYLGSFNILSNRHVIGGVLPKNRQFTFVNILQEWINFKDNDYAMDKYRTERTQYIFTIEHIELTILNKIFYDLILIYKKSNPYAEKIDFIEHVLQETISDLGDLVKNKNKYSILSQIPKTELDVYYRFDYRDSEFIDFIVDANKGVDYYIQYAKKVLKLIDDLDFDNPITNQVGHEELNQNELAINAVMNNEKPITNKQIALIAVYKNETVTRNIHGNDVYNLWLRYNNQNFRLADPESKLKYKNKVILFEKVIEILLEPNKKKAIDDLNMLKLRYEKEYL